MGICTYSKTHLNLNLNYLPYRCFFYGILLLTCQHWQWKVVPIFHMNVARSQVLQARYLSYLLHVHKGILWWQKRSYMKSIARYFCFQISAWHYHSLGCKRCKFQFFPCYHSLNTLEIDPKDHLNAQHKELGSASFVITPLPLQWRQDVYMMTSSNRNIFRATGPLRGIHRSSVNYPPKGQWCGALVISLICT